MKKAKIFIYNNIMSKHECDLCDYCTNSNKEFERHTGTKKHLIATKNEVRCRWCLRKFSCPQSLCHHEKNTCKSIFSDVMKELTANPVEIGQKKTRTKKIKPDIIDELKKEINDLRDQIKDQKIKELENENKELKKDKKSLTNMVNQAGKIMTNLSNIDWIKAKYKNALPFIELTENDILNAFRIKEENNIKKYLLENKDEKECFKDQLIYYNRVDTLEDSFCDLVTKTYKKEQNPEQQSLWTCDVPRGNYAVRENINNDDKSDDEISINDDNDKEIKWISDKQGKKIEKKAIEPILNYAKEILANYVADATKNTERDMKLKAEALDIVKKLKSGKFKTKLKNKLAGHFQLKRID